MPTRRTPIRRSAVGNITPEVVSLWAIVRETRDPRRRMEASLALNAHFNRKPWQVDIEDAHDDQPTELDAAPHRDWAGARELYLVLDRA